MDFLDEGPKGPSEVQKRNCKNPCGRYVIEDIIMDSGAKMVELPVHGAGSAAEDKVWTCCYCDVEHPLDVQYCTNCGAHVEDQL